MIFRKLIYFFSNFFAGENEDEEQGEENEGVDLDKREDDEDEEGKVLNLSSRVWHSFLFK